MLWINLIMDSLGSLALATEPPYDELLDKRSKIDDILKNIENSPLYDEINDELCKEYNTIKLEKQDLDNYDSLKEVREKKNKTLSSIEEENNSPEFKEVLDKLIKNEKNYRDEQVRRARKIENEERERKFLENKRIEEARVRRQKLIEDARLKDQLERAEKLKKLQEKTAINLKREEKVFDRKLDIPIVEEQTPLKINNPLEDKSFDDIILSDDFNSEELFENTKIVPNKIKKEEIVDNNINNESTFSDEKVLDEPKINLEPEHVKIPIWNQPEPVDSFPDMKGNSLFSLFMISGFKLLLPIIGIVSL